MKTLLTRNILGIMDKEVNNKLGEISKFSNNYYEYPHNRKPIDYIPPHIHRNLTDRSYLDKKVDDTCRSILGSREGSQEFHEKKGELAILSRTVFCNSTKTQGIRFSSNTLKPEKRKDYTSFNNNFFADIEKFNREQCIETHPHIGSISPENWGFKNKHRIIKLISNKDELARIDKRWNLKHTPTVVKGFISIVAGVTVNTEKFKRFQRTTLQNQQKGRSRVALHTLARLSGIDLKTAGKYNDILTFQGHIKRDRIFKVVVGKTYIDKIRKNYTKLENNHEYRMENPHIPKYVYMKNEPETVHYYRHTNKFFWQTLTTIDVAAIKANIDNFK